MTTSTEQRSDARHFSAADSPPSRDAELSAVDGIEEATRKLRDALEELEGHGLWDMSGVERAASEWESASDALLDVLDDLRQARDAAADAAFDRGDR